ncbi:serine-rich adhesin for platelets isoform X3 [Penaeus vannamei]|uniref:serine-rich adhesin for platelets isoform X3 n=1 Tax=Penaeus vannamei TaxID=6689 RepID=UPI00387FA8DE
MGWTTKLFVLSLLGLATCQQRSISGGRRRQRVPAGKSEVADFNCPEDFGYYPHPTDCSQYYVCVFGGALQESCTGGLVYSHELQTCDWPRNVVCNLTQAGSGVSTVRITDPRTRSNPVRPVTEPLTSSVSFDDRLDNSLRSSQSLRASNAFDNSDKANRQARFFREQQEPKQQVVSSQRFQNLFTDAAVQESNRRLVNTAPVFPPRQPTPAPRPAPQPTVTPSVDDAFYGDLNFTDADYFYYYDLYDVDYYDNAPTATPAPVRRPVTAAPTSAVEFETRPPPRSTTTTTTSTTTTTTKPRPRTTTITTTTTTTPAGPKLRPIPERRRVAASSSKSFSRGGTARSGSSLPSSNSPTPSSSLRASSSPSRQTASSSRSQPLPSSSSSSRDGLTQLFEFSDFDFDSARPGSSFSFSGVESPDPTPPSRQQSFRQPQSPGAEEAASRPQSRSRSQPQSQSSSGSEARAHPARVQAAIPAKKAQVISRTPANEQLSSQSLRARAPLPSTLSRSSSSASPSSQPSASSTLRASESTSRGSPSTSSSSSSSSSQRSSQSSSSSSGIRSSSSPESTQRSRRPSTSSTSSSSNRGPPASSSSSSSSSSSGPVTVDNSVPKRSRRPTLKPVSEIAPSGATSSVDIWKYPPRRPAPVRPQPPVDTKATKCDPKVCVLPDCYCGGKDIPGGLTPKETPQIVLLTFDDSVNDLNKELYTELFQNGRKNPNGCPITSTMYVSHEWTDYSQVQNLYADGHEIASHSIQHSFGEQFSIKKWAKEIAGQREIMAAYGGVKMEDVRGMRAPFLAIGGNKMFKMLYDYNFTYDSSMPVYENKPPSWPYTLDYKIFHDCMIPPCPTNSYPGVWQVPMVMWQDLTGGRCSMGDACTTPPDAEGVYKMLIKNFERHYTSNRAPFGLFYHAAWFTTPHHKEGFIAFLDTITAMDDVWLVTNWQLLQWMRDPQPLSTVKNFPAFGCNYPDRKRCTSTKVCNVWHKGGVRYMRTCQQCPEKYPWTGNTGVNSPLNDL